MVGVSRAAFTVEHGRCSKGYLTFVAVILPGNSGPLARRMTPWATAVSFSGHCKPNPGQSLGAEPTTRSAQSSWIGPQGAQSIFELLCLILNGLNCFFNGKALCKSIIPVPSASLRPGCPPDLLQPLAQGSARKRAASFRRLCRGG